MSPTKKQELKTIKPEDVKYLADLLISTLGDMKPAEADHIVKRVALTMYNDLLGIEGDIKTSSFRICHTGGVTYISDRAFVPEEAPVKEKE